MSINRIHHILIVLCVVLSWHCTKTTDEPRRREIVFNVDEKLLGTVVVDSVAGVTFSIPKNWHQLEEGDPSYLMLHDSAAFYSYYPPAKSRMVFADSAKQRSMYYSVVPVFDTSDTSITLRQMQSNAKHDDPTATVETAFFFVKSMKVHQLMVSSERMVRFVMIFSEPDSPHAVQLGFLILRSVYTSNITLIESVAGSFSFIHKPITL